MQMQFVNHSEVTFVCVPIPSFRTWVRHWSIRRKIWYLIGPYPTFNHHRTTNPYANPYANASGSTKKRAVIGLCVKLPLYATTHITCTARILAHAFCAYTCKQLCSDVTRTAILNRGPFGGWTPGRPAVIACSLNPHFVHSATHCVGGVTGINIKPLVLMS